jgi:hypothetical protein
MDDLTIPLSVTDGGIAAFGGHKYKNVYIPGSRSSFFCSMFWDTVITDKIVFGEINYLLGRLYDSLSTSVSHTYSDTEIIFPTKVIAYRASVFSNIQSNVITEITINEDCLLVEASAFFGLTKKDLTVNILGNTDIGDSAFSGNKIVNLNWTKAGKTLGSHVVGGYAGSVLRIPDGFETVDANELVNGKVIVGEGPTACNWYGSYTGTTAFKTIVFPDSIQWFYLSVFSNFELGNRIVFGKTAQLSGVVRNGSNENIAMYYREKDGIICPVYHQMESSEHIRYVPKTSDIYLDRNKWKGCIIGYDQPERSDIVNVEWDFEPFAVDGDWSVQWTDYATGQQGHLYVENGIVDESVLGYGLEYETLVFNNNVVEISGIRPKTVCRLKFIDGDIPLTIDSAFYDLKSTLELNLPNRLTKLIGASFYFLHAIEKFTYGSNIVEIGGSALTYIKYTGYTKPTV